MENRLTRRSFTGSMLAAAPALLLGQKSSSEKYNVLFIASDDLNNSLGCYGHPIVKSPNLDRLATRGVRFDRAYCQFPLCGPSRTSILSGMRPDTTKIWKNEMAVRDTMPDAITLPQLFRQSGYTSARFGKMYHMNVPASVGKSLWDDPPSWDIAVSPAGLENTTPGTGRNITPSHSAGNAMHWISFSGSDAGQADAKAAEDTIAYIDRNRAKPWFVGLGFLRPHVPHVAPSRFFDLYPLGRISPVRNPVNDRADIPAASEKTITGRGNDMGMNDADKREALRGYYASVSYMDSLVGRVLDHLAKANQTNRTIIVFWGDHGWHLGEHYRWQKRSLFEESARVPLIVSAPNRKGNGRSSTSLVELIDLYPTIADLCKTTPPPNIEGQSFVPLLDNPGRSWKSAAFTQVAGPDNIVGRAIRTERYRYIRWTGPDAAEELYDCEKDPREFTNLAKEPSSKATLLKMRTLLDNGWRAARAQT
jgi:iduronate 2-sulfatase